MEKYFERVFVPVDLEAYLKRDDFISWFPLWKSQNGKDNLKATLQDQKFGAAIEHWYEINGAVHHDTICGDVTTPIVEGFEKICGNIDTKVKHVKFSEAAVREYVEAELRGRRLQFKEVGTNAVHIWKRQRFIATPWLLYPLDSDFLITEPIIL